MLVRYVALPRGGTLELQASEAFYARVRAQFGLEPGAYVDDTYVRMFVYGACKTAIDSAEGQVLGGIDRGHNT